MKRCYEKNRASQEEADQKFILNPSNLGEEINNAGPDRMQKYFYWLASLILVSIVWLGGCGGMQRQTELADKTINEDPKFRELDDFCRAIPLPSESKLLGKERLFNSVGLVYSYSAPQEGPELLEHFKAHFSKQRWQESDPDTVSQSILYASDSILIRVQFGGSLGTTFSMSCKFK